MGWYWGTSCTQDVLIITKLRTFSFTYRVVLSGVELTNILHTGRLNKHWILYTFANIPRGTLWSCIEEHAAQSTSSSSLIYVQFPSHTAWYCLVWFWGTYGTQCVIIITELRTVSFTYSVVLSGVVLRNLPHKGRHHNHWIMYTDSVAQRMLIQLYPKTIDCSETHPTRLKLHYI